MSRKKEHDLIWLRPEPNERRPRLNREQITATALGIADREGFEAVTMKRIADELDCATMTLYYYVRTKADIVALMHDAILAEILIMGDELPEDWLEAVTAIARRTRDVLLAHPWSLASLNDAQVGVNAMRHMEQSLAVLDALDLEVGEKLALWGIVDAYVFGSALQAIEMRTRAAMTKSNPALVDDAMTFGRQQLATGEFPRLSALDRMQRSRKGPTHNRGAGAPAEVALPVQFERGLNALLDGLARQTTSSGIARCRYKGDVAQ
jgi:AcrR family transcriptional regulator